MSAKLVFRLHENLEAHLEPSKDQVDSIGSSNCSSPETFDEASRRAMDPLRKATLRLHAAMAENEILRSSNKNAYLRITYLEETVRILKGGQDQ